MTTRFSYWKRHNPLLPVYEAEFLKWIQGRTDLLCNKDVLDAGCGMARNSVFSSRLGAHTVCGVELNPEVILAAQENAATCNNITIKQGNLEQLPPDEYADRFDTVMCIGVLHHLPNPDGALENLSRCLREDGHLIAMVYSKEGNEGFLKMLKPARIVAKRLPLPFLEVLALPVTVMYKLLLPFFKGDYFVLQRQAPFSALHYNIVDQLCPDIAHYWTEAELRQLLSTHFQVQRIEHTNARTWTVVAQKKSSLFTATSPATPRALTTSHDH